MKKIIYYVTDHGFGHTTRTIAIVRELQKFGIKIIIRNSNNFQFIKKALPHIYVKKGTTDTGPIINRDGISINRKKSKPQIEQWIEKLDHYADLELPFISKINPDLIISDVSVMPLIAANKIKKMSLVISNFSWYDVLNFISNKHKSLIKDGYDCANFCIKLPLGTKMHHFRNPLQSNLVCRKPTAAVSSIRSDLRINKNEKIILFAIGSPSDTINIVEKINGKIITTGCKIENNQKIYRTTNYIEGQNLVLAADLVICKCGYGMLTECLNSGTPFLYIFDKNHLEQLAISSELKSLGYNCAIDLQQLQKMKFNTLLKSLPIIKKEKNNVSMVAKQIYQIARQSLQN